VSLRRSPNGDRTENQADLTNRSLSGRLGQHEALLAGSDRQPIVEGHQFER
jgi:hypothetical protein